MVGGEEGEWIHSDQTGVSHLGHVAALSYGPGDRSWDVLKGLHHELLQIKEGRHRLSKMGRSLKCRGPSGGEEALASCLSPGHCSRSSFSFILLLHSVWGQRGPGTCGWKASEPGVPSLWVFLTPDSLRTFLFRDPNW